MTAPDPGRGRLILRVIYDGKSQDFTAGPVLVGRDSHAEVEVAHEGASRRHLEFRLNGDDWYVVDLGSTNGTYVNGQATTEAKIRDSTEIGVGGLNAPRIEVKLIPTRSDPKPPPPPGQRTHGQSVLPDKLRWGQVLTIGRTRVNDVVLDDPLVSRRHATLTLDRPAVLRDLDSFNGTFVNGKRVKAAKQIAAGDEIIFGNHTFTWDGRELSARATRHDLTLFAENLTTIVGNDKRLLDQVTFDLEATSLTAVIGPSGAGKSTLLGALTGIHPATHGKVVWQGHNLYKNYDQLRFQIGLVPQQDIQHPQLTVRQGLSYTAELRLPPDTSVEERARRVGDVVSQMQLESQIDNRIGTQLSGGQRKRVSIATELLTAPPLLFLDEPTSGLDPGLDRDVMHLLRRLADEGRVVVVVTHSVLALDVCDDVAVLAPGGRLAYFGSPKDLLQHFGCMDYPAVFDLLDQSDTSLRDRLPSPVSHPATRPLPAVNSAVPPPPSRSMTRQLSTLIRRNLAVTLADRLLLAMLIVLPLILGGLGRIVQGSSGLSLAGTADATGPVSTKEAIQRLTILIIAAALMGTAVTIRELVKERAIFQREYAVGLSPDMYLLSKVGVLGTASFVQSMLVTYLALLGMPGPDDGGVLGLGKFEVALAIGSLGFVTAVIGLAVSAVVASSEQTMPALVGLVMVQLVLSGSLVVVYGRPLLEQVAWMAPARWSFVASGVSLDLHRGRRLTGDATDPLLDPTAAQWTTNMFLLGMLCLIAYVVSTWLVRRSTRWPRR